MWIQIAKREIGVRETTGGENPRILEYHATTKLKASEDEVSWCAAFVGWVLQQCKMRQMHSAAARSYLGYGPKIGFKKYAIVVFKRGNSAWQGHVAFAIDDLGDKIRVLGGNQNNSVCYAIYRKDAVLGYFWPEAETEIRPA